MARSKKEPKQTHINVRRRSDSGGTTHMMEPIVKRAPLREKTYSSGERVMIIELMIFYLVEREFIVELTDITHLVRANLKIQKCEDLGWPMGSRVDIGSIFGRLVELRLIEEGSRRSIRRQSATITAKGKRHIRKQPKRLRLCAQKLVYTDLLEKLGRAIDL